MTYHFIEDEFHRYAIVEDGTDGLKVVTTSVEPTDIAAAVRHLEEDGHTVYLEIHSGAQPTDPPADQPYPKPAPRRAR